MIFQTAMKRQVTVINSVSVLLQLLVDDQQIDCVIRRGDHDYVDFQIKA